MWSSRCATSPERPVALAMAVHDECRWRAIAGGPASADISVRNMVLDSAPTEIRMVGRRSRFWVWLVGVVVGVGRR